MQELCSRFMDGTREWLFAVFDNWLAGTDKMLIVEGGPGVGKSCWAAQLAVSHRYNAHHHAQNIMDTVGKKKRGMIAS
jgi:MoxR-like ATPase